MISKSCALIPLAAGVLARLWSEIAIGIVVDSE